MGALEDLLALKNNSALASITQQQVNVKSYGAKGDGATNDTTAILAAQTYASSIGAELLFPPGTYLITPEIAVSANMTWRGVGDARLITKATAIYNVMVRCYLDGIKLIDLGFDQTGDSALTPDVAGQSKGCHIIHATLFNNLEITNCKFYGYGVTQILTQPSDGYGGKVKVTGCTAYWQRKTNSSYDVSVFNIDGRIVECDNNRVIATNPGSIDYWMPETAYELHMPAGHAFNNEATRTKNGIIHVQAPMQYASYPDYLIYGGVQISQNRFYKCLCGISVWGANTISGVVTRNLIIKDNYHNAHLGGCGGVLAGALKPTTSIEFVNGAVNGGYTRNCKIADNISEYTETKYISGESQITFGTNTIVTTGVAFTDLTVGDYVRISGCTVNAGNNLTAKRITAVSADMKTLTFAAGTFTAGAETAAITIRIDIDNWIGASLAYTYCGAIKGITANGIEDMDIYNNTIISWPFAAFSFHGTSLQHKRIRIYNNRTIDCAYMQPSTEAYHGIFNFNNCDDVDMRGNKCIKGGVKNKTPLKTLYLGATTLTGLKFIDNDVSTLTAIEAAYETNDTILKTMITDTPALIALGCVPYQSAFPGNVAGLTLDHTWQGECARETVSEDAGLFGLVYLYSDGYKKAKADADATLPCVGLQCTAGTGVQTILKRGYARDDTWNWTVGALLWVSAATGGLITSTKPTTTGNRVQCIGYAVSADVIYFNPQYTFVEVA